MSSHARAVQPPHQRQEARLVGRHRPVGHAQDEGLVALVAAAVQQVGRLGVGAGDDDAWHAHDVELEPGGAEPLDLLVLGHQHLAALVPAFLGARLLVLDVVPRDADLDEPADQVAHVGVAAVSGVRVGDDVGAEVDLRRCVARSASVIRSRAKRWLRSAVSSARTSPAASSGTWLSG